MATRSLSLLAPQFLIAVRDDGGRPLGEHRAPPDARAGVAMETTVCRYCGTRLHDPNPMNVSALRPLRCHWDSVMGYIHELTVLYAVSQRGPAPRPSACTGGNLWRIAKLAECVPQLLLLRCREPLGPAALPASVAALYKMALRRKYAFHW